MNHYFLMRHGEAESNVGGILSCYPEKKAIHLTSKGHLEIEKAAVKLHALNINLIFSSDLLRTTETAEIVSKAIGVPIIFDERLREINFGEFNGRTESSYLGYFPSVFFRFETAPSGGETLHEVRDRMVGFVEWLGNKYDGKNILIVSHGDPIRMLRTAFENLSDEETLNVELDDNGQIRELKGSLLAVFDSEAQTRRGRDDKN